METHYRSSTIERSKSSQNASKLAISVFAYVVLDFKTLSFVTLLLKLLHRMAQSRPATKLLWKKLEGLNAAI